MVKGTIELKESYQAWLACRILEVADRYRLAKQSVALAVMQAKPLVLEELVEVMEHDWLALKRFWQTVTQLRREYFAPTVYCGNGVLSDLI